MQGSVSLGQEFIRAQESAFYINRPGNSNAAGLGESIELYHITVIC